MKKSIAIIGVGNQIMGDEGTGVETLHVLRQMSCPEGVELIDAGTAFFSIVSDLKDFKKLIIVDVVRGGKPPGTVYRFEMEDVKGGDILVSLHDVGVVDSLMMESLVGKIPEEIVFFGIEPQRVELSTELSETVKKRLGYLAQRILEEVANFADLNSWHSTSHIRS
jgi:hydrogenase maturation protease